MSFLDSLTKIIDWIWGFSLAKKKVKIAILGGKGSGKTELWRALQGKKNTSEGGTSIDQIPTFDLDDKVSVIKTLDIGGGDDWVGYEYDKLIENSIFIFYLVDMTRIDEIINETRQRIRKIIPLKGKNCELKIIATFFDKYKGTKEDAINEVYKKLFDKPISGLPEDLNFKENIQVMCTLKEEDIKELKNQIINTVMKNGK